MTRVAVRQPGDERGPACWSCSSCADLRKGRPRTDAVYVWTSQPSGNEVPLCIECCAEWRVNAADDPTLEPYSIRQISAIR